MEKAIAFHHDKDNDMLKLVGTLPNLAKICLDKSTDAKIYPFTERDKNLFKKIREDVVGGPSVVFTRKAIVEEFFCPKVYKHMQIYCWDRCQPNIPLLDVPTYAQRSLYALGHRFRNQ